MNQSSLNSKICNNKFKQVLLLTIELPDDNFVLVTRNYVHFFNRTLNWLGLIEDPFLDYPDRRCYYPLLDHQSVYREIVEMVADKGERTVAFLRADNGMGKTVLGKRLVNAAFSGNKMGAVGIYLDQSQVHTPATLLNTSTKPWGNSRSSRTQTG